MLGLRARKIVKPRLFISHKIQILALCGRENGAYRIARDHAHGLFGKSVVEVGVVVAGIGADALRSDLDVRKLAVI